MTLNRFDSLPHHSHYHYHPSPSKSPLLLSFITIKSSPCKLYYYDHMCLFLLRVRRLSMFFPHVDCYSILQHTQTYLCIREGFFDFLNILFYLLDWQFFYGLIDVLISSLYYLFIYIFLIIRVIFIPSL